MIADAQPAAEGGHVTTRRRGGPKRQGARAQVGDASEKTASGVRQKRHPNVDALQQAELGAKENTPPGRGEATARAARARRLEAEIGCAGLRAAAPTRRVLRLHHLRGMEAHGRRSRRGASAKAALVQEAHRDGSGDADRDAETRGNEAEVQYSGAAPVLRLRRLSGRAALHLVE